MDDTLLKFMQSQRLMTLATVDEKNLPFVASVYYSITKDGEILFVSALDSKHIQNIMKKKDIAFNVSWYDSADMANRKGVQGQGSCRQLTNVLEMGKYFSNHFTYFPDWDDYLTIDNVVKGLIHTRPFIIKPTFIKFWNDELYGEDPKEFVIKI